MDELISALRLLVEKKGAKDAAAFLGDPLTRNIQNWIRNKEVPPSKEGLVRKILTLEGYLK